MRVVCNPHRVSSARAKENSRRLARKNWAGSNSMRAHKSRWKCMRVSGKRERSLNSQQLSSSFGPGIRFLQFNMLLLKSSVQLKMQNNEELCCKVVCVYYTNLSNLNRWYEYFTSCNGVPRRSQWKKEFAWGSESWSVFVKRENLSSIISYILERGSRWKFLIRSIIYC